uniref:Uncharacterized protein n=1 Tax=Cacopsylla melanoneura TaxID=428564 RepID=A0A8D8WWB0_9HEMI
MKRVTGNEYSRGVLGTDKPLQIVMITSLDCGAIKRVTNQSCVTIKLNQCFRESREIGGNRSVRVDLFKLDESLTRLIVDDIPHSCEYMRYCTVHRVCHNHNRHIVTVG